ncbi:hypothetical protein CYMTET_8001 [Cymbomonas tetramitiformis]|uniref:Uncharacterized protein n=1 Tax=Cymbomonas tetramitiformis TaxID=36881 RepID=A0AAE0LGX5_9CHLO|nr:hypothetical protein CYMTET_8001 [Cymbomonas tetramitiformis]
MDMNTFINLSAEFARENSLDRLKVTLKKRQQDEESAWLQDQTPNQTREVSGQQAKDHNAEEDAAAEMHVKEQEKVEEVASLMEDLNNMSEADLAELLQVEEQGILGHLRLALVLPVPVVE